MKEPGVRKLAIILTVAGLCVLFFVAHARAQALVRMEIPSSPNPVGSGARALGMGGAFIAVADDATAASWNPGGLIQLEKPEISAVVSYIYREEDNTFRNNPEASGSFNIDKYNLNYLSAAYPFKAAEHNMIVSLNYQHLFDFNRDWSFKFAHPDPLFVAPVQYKYEQAGALYALGLAYAVEITPDFSAGITLNYWGDFIYENKWKQKYHLKGDVDLGGIPGSFTSDKTEEYSFSGWNANLGFRWKMTEHWTLGGVFKLPFTADVKHSINSVDSTVFPTVPTANSTTTTSLNYDDELDMPMAYGVGLAYRFSDSFTVSGDIYRTHWNDFAYKDSAGNKTSPVSGIAKAASDIDPTTWFRAGAEYLIIGRKFVVPLRAGLFYDPAPAEGSPDEYYGFSLGSGIAYKRWIFDVAYQYRTGDGVSSSMLKAFSQDVSEHIVYTSLIVHF
ncbi:MAG: outer membrane protein transport protein [Desulfobacterales bacterium]|nr:outer membrane protein transport protein [Desulfobacterales bacterium]